MERKSPLKKNEKFEINRYYIMFSIDPVFCTSLYLTAQERKMLILTQISVNKLTWHFLIVSHPFRWCLLRSQAELVFQRKSVLIYKTELYEERTPAFSILLANYFHYFEIIDATCALCGINSGYCMNNLLVLTDMLI